ncbi:MAG TPA: flagellar filament capping protein FliD [Syntrophomonas sp.]|nr:flagellar filament capping protein FliD [Syntrophomonas sp.]
MTSSTSSSTYSYLTTSSSRISGLASGIDTDSIISKLMKAERVPLDKLEQKKQVLEWQQETYRNLNVSLDSLRTSLSSLRLQSSFRAKTAVSSAATVATATAGANASEGTYTITVNHLATGISKASAAKLAEETDADGNKLSLYNQFSEFSARGYSSGDTIKATVNGTELSFSLSGDTISTVVAKINNADLGVTASYDTSLNRFFLVSDSTGSDAELTVTGDEANFLSSSSQSSILGLSIEADATYTGTNASVDMGDAAGLESSTNSIVINGITFSLKELGTTTVTVTRDVDAIMASITGFVDAYNQILGELNTELQEERDDDYEPLTDAQKAEMSEDEINKWNAKASAGLLRHDPLLRSITSNFRYIMSSFISGISDSYNSLSSIGIASESYKDQGILTIDEDDLREALTKDPAAVEKIFTNSSDTAEEKGIAVRLYDAAVKSITDLTDKAGSDTGSADLSVIGKRLTALDKQISDWEDKLEDIENRYYNKFTQMETFIAKMNSQSSWLSSIMGSD